MACRSVFRTVFLKEPCIPTSFPVVLFSIHKSFSVPVLCCGCKLIYARTYRFPRRSQLLNCSNNENPSSSQDDLEQGPPQEVILKAISEVSKTEGRVGQTTNVVIGGTVHNDSTNEWLALDKKVNSYPTERGFTAIGTGGDDFVHSMVVAVESVIQQPVPEGQVRQKLSSGGKYVSVNIGPIQVVSSEQVQAVYKAMKRDVRMKYFL
ncbi:uncharacterized protein LOC107781981 isoform X1 [Nicotiana tabacum]|uniref:Uncharacterized protein LOC107781981 isoform X1 n=2 Tax=Nicotiana TaxID=4085 RepID=A0A1S3Z1E3_TOBAC|nr:PREDICTED: uncharacterized protein LOC104243072 isoform X1 [Nicotiana sylvestris]XP_016458281.1 PREDICTED: uncharacterized protein LOC107781981 isoform X1 [Nicotiana tabacum]